MNKTRKITEGAMMVAIVGLLLFINRQFAGMLEYAIYWILTFPILIYTARYGVKDALVPSVCMILLGFMIAAPTTIFYLFCCCVVGIVYGAGVRKKWKNGTLLFWTGIFTFLSYLVTTVVFASVFGYDPQEDMEFVKWLFEMLHISSSIDIAKIVVVAAVGSAILMTILQSICIHIIANVILLRLKIEVHPMKKLVYLKVPKEVGYTTFIFWILFLCRNVLKLRQDILLAVTGIYFMLKIFAIAYGAMCLLCIFVMMRKRWLVLFLAIFVFVPVLQDIIALIGVIDMIADLRGIFIEVMKRGVTNGSSGKL